MRDGDVKRRQQTERARLIGSGQEDDAAGFGDKVIDAGDSSVRRQEIVAAFGVRERDYFKSRIESIASKNRANPGRFRRQAKHGGRIALKQAKHNFAGGDRVSDKMSETACRAERIAEAGDRIGTGSLIADAAAGRQGRRTAWRLPSVTASRTCCKK